TLSTIPADKPVVVVCYTGQSASQATSVLNMLGYDATALLHGMSSWTTDPEVYVKRFTPDTHAHDYTIDLETHQLTGSYELPAPLVEITVQPESETEPDQGAEDMIPASVVSANCISCHTDKKELQELAVEEEVKSELTSGEG
ncbi:MAG: rhodanese-like domain-containing protein, partial [Anaerolineales bacterium]|nr:rhodanese-like domain-containing protein [Anaerolineales bacterium]